MKKLEQLYEGKAKKVFATDDPKAVLVSYKDDATAFNGLKKGQIAGKGAINNQCSNIIFRVLENNGVPTHFIEEESATETLVKKVEIVPLEVIVRNIAAGSFTKRYGVPEGTVLKSVGFEFSYKNDELGDPMINDWYAMAMGLATKDELDTIRELAFKTNSLLTAFFMSIGLDLVDFKLEFGRYDGKIILADEISPDTCRLWDSETHKKLDKDRFRRDLGDVEEAYEEVMNRVAAAGRRLLGK